MLVLPNAHSKHRCRHVILDPFAGSGTTVLAAVKEGYDATGIEVTDVYADLARKRLETELNAA